MMTGAIWCFNSAATSPAENPIIEPPHDEPRHSDVTTSAHRLLRHRGQAAAPVAGTCAPRAMAYRQSGGLGHQPADAAPGLAGPDGRIAPAGRAALELARIRHAGWRVAIL